MEAVVLIIHLVLALAIIGMVLLQRSEGGGLGIGGSGGMGGFASARTAAGALQKTTAICGALFFTTSLVLGILAGTHHGESILDALEETPPAVTAPTEAAPEAPIGEAPSTDPAATAPETVPSVPTSD